MRLALKDAQFELLGDVIRRVCAEAKQKKVQFRNPYSWSKTHEFGGYYLIRDVTSTRPSKGTSVTHTASTGHIYISEKARWGGGRAGQHARLTQCNLLNHNAGQCHLSKTQ